MTNITLTVEGNALPSTPDTRMTVSVHARSHDDAMHALATLLALPPGDTVVKRAGSTVWVERKLASEPPMDYVVFLPVAKKGDAERMLEAARA